MNVIEQALKEARHVAAAPQGRRQHLAGPVPRRAPGDHIIKLLAETGFPAKRLEVEITENSLLEDRDQVLNTIQSLKNLGVSVSLDDFGTGYASLAQVNSLPVDRIKIDRSFISTIVKSEQTAAIVGTIANLGHTLNVPITAEGVEVRADPQRAAEVRMLGSPGLAVRPCGVRRERPHLPRPQAEGRTARIIFR